MTISILTAFPQMFSSPFDHSIIKRGRVRKLVKLEIVNLRNFGVGKHKIIDDRPFGGGVGMIMRVDVIERAISSAKRADQILNSKKTRIILLDPKGETFNQKKARELSKFDHLILIAGHYEGVDERVKEYLVDETISIGDYVLTGGEIPSMVIVDSVVRLIPGVLKKPEAIQFESFSTDNLEHPQYTRPSVYKGWRVPPVLISGNHKAIEEWRKGKEKRV